MTIRLDSHSIQSDSHSGKTEGKVQVRVASIKNCATGQAEYIIR